MAVRAGLRVVHVDVDPRTMHMIPDQLEESLQDQHDAETAVIVDHTFGYPCRYVAKFRAAHPEILLIEDCVRSLGARVDGQAVGAFGDWVLLSMYKTIRGAECGAVLLTRTAYDIPPGPVRKTAFRQFASLIGPLRVAYEYRKRRYANYRPSPRDFESFTWEPRRGQPDALSQACFWKEIRLLQARVSQRRLVAAELAESLQSARHIRLIERDNNCQLAATHLSFTFEGESRDRFLESLHRRGLFLIRAWNTVPAFIRSLQGTFPFGSTGGTYLADRIAHIPIDGNLSSERRQRLVGSILPRDS
jgi:dTDP-4-amino-4,6-dideoxygalactose transaminase